MPLRVPFDEVRAAKILNDDGHDGDQVQLAEDGLEDGHHAAEVRGRREVAVADSRERHEAEVDVVDQRRRVRRGLRLREERLTAHDGDEAVGGGEEHGDEEVHGHGAIEGIGADDGVLHKSFEDGRRGPDHEQDDHQSGGDRRGLVIAEDDQDDGDEDHEGDERKGEPKEAALDLRGAQREPGGRREDHQRRGAGERTVAGQGEGEETDDEQEQHEAEAVGEARRALEETCTRPPRRVSLLSVSPVAHRQAPLYPSDAPAETGAAAAARPPRRSQVTPAAARKAFLYTRAEAPST